MNGSRRALKANPLAAVLVHFCGYPLICSGCDRARQINRRPLVGVFLRLARVVL